jgi:hypothetical protein
LVLNLRVFHFRKVYYCKVFLCDDFAPFGGLKKVLQDILNSENGVNADHRLPSAPILYVSRREHVLVAGRYTAATPRRRRCQPGCDWLQLVT